MPFLYRNGDTTENKNFANEESLRSTRAFSRSFKRCFLMRFSRVSKRPSKILQKRESQLHFLEKMSPKHICGFLIHSNSVHQLFLLCAKSQKNSCSPKETLMFKFCVILKTLWTEWMNRNRNICYCFDFWHIISMLTHTNIPRHSVPVEQ